MEKSCNWSSFKHQQNLIPLDFIYVWSLFEKQQEKKDLVVLRFETHANRIVNVYFRGKTLWNCFFF